VTTRRTLLGGALAGGCLVALTAVRAQAPDKPALIGWLSSGPLVPSPHWDAFVEGMRERGWVEGRDYTVLNLRSEGRNERLPALAAEMVQRKVDLIICGGTPPASAAMKATPTIPVLFYYAGDPVGSGLVASLARPGGNVTGLGGLATGQHAKQLQLLKQAVPEAMRVAMVFNPDFPLHAANRAEVEPAAQRLGVTLRPVELRAPADIDGAFASMVRERVHALHFFGQPFLFAQGPRVAALAMEHKLPAMIPFVEVARTGLLMAYGSRMIDDVRRLPYYVDRILKGASPAELPVEQPTRFYLTLNLKTAKTIGLAIPQALRLQADEVIE
jgi:putative tryptophan/tyrosine transport system substrate-binding protein